MNGFTGKEGDEEVGVAYFGERYLIARLGRWLTPDPKHIHDVGGGEVLNSFHYAAGGLLQLRDELGLDPDDTVPTAVDPTPQNEAETELIESAVPVDPSVDPRLADAPNGPYFNPRLLSERSRDLAPGVGLAFPTQDDGSPVLETPVVNLRLGFGAEGVTGIGLSGDLSYAGEVEVGSRE